LGTGNGEAPMISPSLDYFIEAIFIFIEIEFFDKLFSFLNFKI